MAYGDDDYSPMPAAEPFARVDGQGTRYAEMNSGITPMFFHAALQNYAKSEIEGHPVFDEFEFVKILIAGDPYNAHVEPVTQAIVRRWPTQYHEWKTTALARAAVTGMPIKQWPPINGAKAAELEGLNIFTVEALAQLPDIYLSKAFDLRELREKARGWLEQAKDGGAAARYAAEADRQRIRADAMEAQLATMSDQMAAVLKRLEAQPAQPPQELAETLPAGPAKRR